VANFVNLAYQSINHYLVDCRDGKLLLDPGWNATITQLSHALRRIGSQPKDVKYVMATHFHPDHAGLVQEVKLSFGSRLIIHERQIPYLADLELFYARKGGGGNGVYVPIAVWSDDVVVTSQGGRKALDVLGIGGQIVETPGHSEDSVSLLLDDGSAFVGDLHLPDQVDGEMVAPIRESWRKLLSLGMRTAYRAHGGPNPAADVELRMAGT
jgi:ribonuclease/clavin/mitogillin